MIKARQSIDAMLTTNRKPTNTKSGAVILKDESKRHQLVDTSGSKTKIGAYWEQQTGQDLPVGGFDSGQTPFREGNTEFIYMRNGEQRAVRQYSPVDNEFKFTVLGKSFYARLKRNYVVQVPVIIKGKRKDGTEYNVKSSLPVSRMGIDRIQMPLNLTAAARTAKIKEIVTAQLNLDEPLYEVSQEEWRYDQSASGQWVVNEETVDIDLETQESVITLDRRVGVAPYSLSQIPFSHELLKEAFSDTSDMCCVPRQISILLNLDFGVVCNELAEIEANLYGNSTWTVKGCTPRMVIELCKKRSIGVCIMHNGHVIDTMPGPTPLVAALHESHLYFYQNMRIRKKLMAWRTDCKTGTKLRREHAASASTPEAEKWLNFAYEVVPGHYYASEEAMPYIRAWFLQNRRCPRVIMKDPTCIRGLVYTCTKLDAVRGCISVHSAPLEFGPIIEWLKFLPVKLKYTGQGLPNVSAQVMLLLIKYCRTREYLSGERKAALLEEYDFCCANCGTRSDDMEWDHVHALRELTQDMDQVFQPLCLACHQMKTANEPRRMSLDFLASHFEKSVYEQYVMSKRPPPIVNKLKECDDIQGCQIADTIRCRRRALEFNSHDIPIFCPMDVIETVDDYTLGDINLVIKKQRLQSASLDLCYTQGWMHRCLTEFLLHHGIISWEHVTHRLTATGRYPPHTFREPLRIMDAAWQEAGHAYLSKKSVNSLIGLWAIDESFDYRCFSSNHDADCPAGALKSTFHFENGSIMDFLVKERLDAGGISNRPLHDLCMCAEHVRVGTMLYALKRARCVVYEIKTDSCLYRPPKRRKQSILIDITYKDLHTMRDRCEGKANRLNDWCQMRPSEVDEKVYRVQEATEADRMKTCPMRPSRTCKLTLPSLHWKELPIDEAESKVIVRNESLLVVGSPGTGKTTLLQGITERLRSLGKRVDIISKTHCASSRAGGKTADHWVRKHIINGSCSADYVWIDEISQLDCELIATLNRLTYTDTKFLLSGDFNQFAPIGNNWRGTPVTEYAFEKSRLLHRMSDGNVLTLIECKRSDTELFDFYSRLIPGGSLYGMPVDVAVQEARQQFRYRGICDLNLTLSHRKRIAINHKVNLHKKPDDAVFLYYPPLQRLSLNAPQSMWIWPGIELLGCVPIEKHGIRNGVMYTVESIKNTTVTLEGGIELSSEDTVRMLRLSHAMTYASVQGRETEKSLCLHDTGNAHISMKHLYVALSRARKAAYVRVE